jgi:hypothetical protein
MTENARISQAKITTDAGNRATVRLTLQGRGGWEQAVDLGTVTSGLLMELFRIAEVRDWDHLKGKAVVVRRTEIEGCNVVGLRHHINEDWMTVGSLGRPA